MNRIFKSVLFLTAIISFCWACDRSNQDEIIIESPIYEVDTVIVNAVINALVTDDDNNFHLGCHLLQFPLEVLLNSESILEVDSELELIELLGTDVNDPVVDFVYPITTIDEEGNAYMNQDAIELAIQFANCVPEDWWGYCEEHTDIMPAFMIDTACIELLYPLTLVDLDGKEYLVNSEVEFMDLVLSIDPLFFTFPLTVLFEGEATTVSDYEAFYDLIILCEGVNPPVINDTIGITSLGCFDLLYPFTVLVEGSSEVVIENEDDYMNLLLQGLPLELLFPFSVIDESGITYEITCIEDLIEAYEIACDIVLGNDPCELDHVLYFHLQNYFNEPSCAYLVVFPVQLDYNGGILLVEDDQDYAAIYNNLPLEEISLIYPVQVQVASGTGDILTFNSEAELNEFLEGCQ